jgi:hypothetical protein
VSFRYAHRLDPFLLCCAIAEVCTSRYITINFLHFVDCSYKGHVACSGRLRALRLQDTVTAEEEGMASYEEGPEGDSTRGAQPFRNARRAPPLL